MRRVWYPSAEHVRAIADERTAERQAQTLFVEGGQFGADALRALSASSRPVEAFPGIVGAALVRPTTARAPCRTAHQLIAEHLELLHASASGSSSTSHCASSIAAIDLVVNRPLVGHAPNPWSRTA